MFRKFFYAVACLTCAIIAAQGQSNYAVVRGSVLDPQHRPVAGAHIRLTSTETGAQRDVVANETGMARATTRTTTWICARSA
jgi:hypothetical protein